MMYPDLMSIADEFDIFLFDAYGVFWEGNGFYPRSRETMAELVNAGKTVAVISNTTRLCPDMVLSYDNKGLKQHRDYTHFVTSGDVLKEHLHAQNIHFTSCPNPRKYYVIGLPHKKAFADTAYEEVETMEEADFIYCGVPFMYEKDIRRYPQYADQYLPARTDKQGKIYLWDTLTAEPFAEFVRLAEDLKKPLLNANPDLTAREGHPLLEGSPTAFVIRNGTIAEMFRKAGIEVVEFGKPHRNIYDYTFRLLQADGLKINKTRTCMIGDTVRTDIKGALNYGIKAVLCMDTGITANEIAKGNSLENICQAEKIDVQQIIQISSIGGK